ncbi:MAG: ATP-binding cassette domain-containing protein [Negativicutes bacterium]|jgi:ABC-2 type transport system ATP-binding protein
MNDNIIQVSNLCKNYGPINAVNSISFNVGRGEAFAFLGPNGAGKSTTIKMLVTLLEPSNGDALINGLSLANQAAAIRRLIGYVPQLISVDGTLTAYENLLLMAKLYDIPRQERVARACEVLEFLNLADQKNALVKTFSGGMIRRLEIGQAMIHQPEIIYLDEPTSGLDPVARQNVWDHIMDLRDRLNTTVFFSTHQMEEAENYSDRLAIIHHGKIEAIGSSAQIKTATNKNNATLDDAFIHFTGSELNTAGRFRDIRQTRQNERRLG